MLQGLVRRLDGWRSLRPVQATVVRNPLSIRRDRRVWAMGYVPIHRPPPRDGSDCSAPARPFHVVAWQVAGSRLLFQVYDSTGGCMCDCQARQVEEVPGYEPAAARDP